MNLSENKLTRGILRPWVNSAEGVPADWGHQENHYRRDLKGLKMFAKALQNNRSLTVLHLADNALDAEAATHLAGILKSKVCVDVAHVASQRDSMQYAQSAGHADAT